MLLIPIHREGRAPRAPALPAACPHSAACSLPLPSDGRGEGQGEVRVLNLNLNLTPNLNLNLNPNPNPNPSGRGERREPLLDLSPRSAKPFHSQNSVLRPQLLRRLGPFLLPGRAAFPAALTREASAAPDPPAIPRWRRSARLPPKRGRLPRPALAASRCQIPFDLMPAHVDFVRFPEPDPSPSPPPAIFTSPAATICSARSFPWMTRPCNSAPGLAAP